MNRTTFPADWGRITALLLCSALSVPDIAAQSVTVDASPEARRQTIDGFGAHQGGEVRNEQWWQELFYDDLRASIYRIDLTPKFVSPYSDRLYNSPWFHNDPPLPGPDVRATSGLGSGIYFYRLTAGDVQETRRVAMVR